MADNIFDLLKVSRTTTNFVDLFKFRKATANYFKPFKVSKMTTNFFDLFKDSKQPSMKQAFNKYPSMHCLKHNQQKVDNIIASKKITIIQNQD